MLKNNFSQIDVLGAGPAGLGVGYYAKKYGYVTGDFPNAERYANQSISLPVHPKISKGDIKYICESLMELIGEN